MNKTTILKHNNQIWAWVIVGWIAELETNAFWKWFHNVGFKMKMLFWGTMFAMLANTGH
jgi:hypothetical protein